MKDPKSFVWVHIIVCVCVDLAHPSTVCTRARVHMPTFVLKSSVRDGHHAGVDLFLQGPSWAELACPKPASLHQLVCNTDKEGLFSKREAQKP